MSDDVRIDVPETVAGVLERFRRERRSVADARSAAIRLAMWHAAAERYGNAYAEKHGAPWLFVTRTR